MYDIYFSSVNLSYAILIIRSVEEIRREEKKFSTPVWPQSYFKKKSFQIHCQVSAEKAVNMPGSIEQLLEYKRRPQREGKSYCPLQIQSHSQRQLKGRRTYTILLRGGNSQ